MYTKNPIRLRSTFPKIYYISMRSIAKTIMATEFSGTMGKTETHAKITGTTIQFKQKNQWLNQNEIWLVCFERVSPRLKMCDVIFVTPAKVCQLSIARDTVDTISQVVQVPIHHTGPDPLPWSQFEKTAKKYGWQKEDWHHLFEDESLSEESSSSDDDYLPDDESSDESSDDED